MSITKPATPKLNAFTRNAYRKADTEQNFEPKKLAALTVKYDGVPYKVSRKLAFAKSAVQLSVTCPKTGISGLVMEMPSVPGFALINNSPLSDIDNARGIAQRGRSYLTRLDTVILAGIFITLATEYDLLSTGAQWKAHEANSALRTCGPLPLIEGILLIETWIHSKNAIYLPRLSLLSFPDDTVSSVAGRITNWLKLLHDAILSPDTTTYDPKAKIEKITFSSVEKIKKIESKKNKVLVEARKNFRIAKQVLKEASPKLKSASAKLKNYLLTLSTGSLLLTADQEMLNLLILRLEACEEQDDAKRVITVLSTDWSLLRKAEEESSDYSDFLELNTAPKTEEQGAQLVSMLDVPKESAIRSHSPIPNALDSSKAEIEETNSAGANGAESEPEPSYKGMSSIQAILARKAWLRRTGRTEALPFKTVEEESKRYSVENGTIYGTAPVYVPSADKEKLAKG